MDQMLFKEFLFLALVVILFDRVEPSRSILVKGSMRNVYVTLFGILTKGSSLFFNSSSNFV